MRLLLGSTALTLLLLPLSACGGDDDLSGARAAVDVLTQKLGQHTLDGVALTQDSAAKELTEQGAGLAAYPVTVKSSGVSVKGSKGTADLAWDWDLSGHHWTYSTTVDLARNAKTWQIAWQPSTLAPDLTAGEKVSISREQPERADIVGPGGAPIVTKRSVVRVGLDKAAIPAAQVATSARRIAQAVGVTPATFVKSATAAGPKAFVEAIVLRTADVASTVRAGFAQIPGARQISDTMPLAPSSEFASSLLGRVGPATAELVTASKGRIVAGDQVGLSGLEARYDEQLAGTPTVKVQAVSTAAITPSGSASASASSSASPSTTPSTSSTTSTSGTTRVLAHWDGTPGKPVQLTLNLKLQAKAEKILDQAGSETSPASAIVAIRPSTGEIITAANGPGNKGLNAATFGQYPPGSTFKIVSSLALIRAGVTPDSTVTCPQTVTVDGRSFKNYNDYPASKLGTLSFKTAIANSCNTAVIGQRNRLGKDDLTQAAAALGVGVDHDLGFPAYFGQVPAPAGATEKAADMIGQGKVLASPMAMATVAASVAAGHVVVPHLVVGHTVTASPKVPLTAKEAAQLRVLMRAVVTEGSGALLRDLPGNVGAKTGTAEFGTPNAQGALPTHVWMIATQGDLAVAVFVATGETGSGTAGPLLKAFLR
ncbi:penicillin-binding transpeptidase domain-containing protein [Nocardioides sp.]|uniref:penicillin-binding transpeptidase domain-containing protein n=1 Tax=Nocardioides sp. TaxID=35761 RepID=UPI0026368140|nr:penicillin-binding transpeptidase domain-containing protein [Nocardioides sp.]